MIAVSPNGWLEANGSRYRCALGRGGVQQEKTEGDGVTPVGCFALRHVLYRADRMARPVTTLRCTPIRPNDGWCEDPASPHYNRQVEIPLDAGHERLWRDDGLYDVIVVLGHNDDPPEPGRGSAIFLHVARPDYGPTLGCVAVARDDLLRILEACGPADSLEVRPPADDES